jgi:hypothetical protein
MGKWGCGNASNADAVWARKFKEKQKEHLKNGNKNKELPSVRKYFPTEVSIAAILL